MVRKYQEKHRLAPLTVAATNATSEQQNNSAASEKVQNHF